MQFVVAIRKVVKKEQSVLHKEGLFERASFGVRTWRGGGGSLATSLIVNNFSICSLIIINTCDRI